MRSRAIALITPLLLLGILLSSIMSSGCARKSPNLVRTYYQLNVSESTLDHHLQEIRASRGVRNLTHQHDSSNKVTLHVYVDSKNPYEAQEKLRSLGYTRVRD